LPHDPEYFRAPESDSAAAAQGWVAAGQNDLFGVLIESGFDHLFVYITRHTMDLDYARARAAVRKLLASTDDIIAGGSVTRP
jgi:hypothetical protein